MIRRLRYILLAMAAGMVNASLALGASITIISTNGGFTVQGESMNGVSGVEMTVGYDASKLASPTVTWGSLVSGALSIANTTVPGSIRIAIIKHDPFVSSSGPIAAISFATQGSSCGITSLTAKLIDDKAAAVPVQTDIAAGAACAAAPDPGLISTPGIPFSQPAATAAPATTTAQSTAATTASATSQVPMGLGTISMPGDSPPKKEERPAESKAAGPAEPADSPETVPHPQAVKPSSAEKTAEETEPAGIKQTVYGSVLDRFRTYQGEKTPDILSALFTKTVSPSILQDPPVAVSDGTSKVRVTIELTEIKGTSTNFALSGAKLVSLKNEEESGKWVLDILPQANTLKAAVTIVSSRSIIDFPLTVVPPAAAVTGKKADFDTFLKDSGAKSPKYDLNGDGRHDYLDDFIYTAHYLIASRAAAGVAK